MIEGTFVVKKYGGQECCVRGGGVRRVLGDGVVSMFIWNLTTKIITGNEKRQPSILRNNVPKDTWACNYMCHIIA